MNVNYTLNTLPIEEENNISVCEKHLYVLPIARHFTIYN